MTGTIHLRRRRIFTIFDPYPPPVGSFLLLICWQIRPNFDPSLTLPPKNADVLNGWPHRLYAVLYTSGSTGTPKGARILHSAVLNRLMWQWEKFPYQPNDVCAFKVSTKIFLSNLQWKHTRMWKSSKFKFTHLSWKYVVELMFFGGSWKKINFVFPNYQQKYLMDFCSGRLFRLGMLWIHLSELSCLEKNNNIST